MQPGNVSQTVWRRTIENQIYIEERDNIARPTQAEQTVVIPAAAPANAASTDSALATTNVAAAPANAASADSALDATNVAALSAEASVASKSKNVGFYATIRAIHELACRGGICKGIQIRITLPISAHESDVKAILGGIRQICKEQHISMLSIQVETSAAVLWNLVHITAHGEAPDNHVLRLTDIKPEQEIILCGSIALEGMLQIVDISEKELAQRFIPTFIRQIKARREELFLGNALAAARPLVSAMQVVGSGGIFSALWDLAEEAGVGLQADFRQMTICQETVEVCEFYRLNPYRMVATGAVLMVTDRGEDLLEALRECGVKAVRLGKTTADSARLITGGEDVRYLDRPAPDALALWQEEELKKIFNI